MRHLLVSALLLVTSTACIQESIVDVRDDVVVAFSVPVSFSDTVFVSLGRAIPGGEEAPLSGAVLEVAVQDRRFRMTEVSTSVCGDLLEFSCYVASVGEALRPGREVVLEGALPGGARISGAATLPPVPDLRIEGQGQVDTVRGIVHPRTDPGPALLGLDEIDGYVAPAHERLTEATVWEGERTFSCPVVPTPLPGGIDLRTPSRVAVGILQDPCPDQPDLAWDSLAVPVTFLAYDRHFTEWRGVPDSQREEVRFGLSGVFGVFGAATPRTFILIVTHSRLVTAGSSHRYPPVSPAPSSSPRGSF